MTGTDKEESVMNWEGRIESVHFATEVGAPMTTPESIHAIAGEGVAGDRYSRGEGTFSYTGGARRQITLFETEVLETIARDHNVHLAPHECRMNLITRDVPLTHLVFRTFRVGNVLLHGLKLNEPCARRNEVTGKRVIKALIHRCGLFCEILEGGEIRPGAIVAPADRMAKSA